MMVDGEISKSDGKNRCYDGYSTSMMRPGHDSLGSGDWHALLHVAFRTEASAAFCSHLGYVVARHPPDCLAGRCWQFAAVSSYIVDLQQEPVGMNTLNISEHL